MELDLTTPTSHLPFWEHTRTSMQHPHTQIFFLPVEQNFMLISQFLLPNPSEVKNVIGDYLAMENLEIVKTLKK
jgi:hypothetical protein